MAWTERYVRADAAGGGDGTTDTNSGANGAWTLAEAITNVTAGMRVNIRSGTYANGTTSRNFNVAGDIWWRGFNSTPGDLDANPVYANMPLLTFTGTSARAQATAAQQRFSSIAFESEDSNGTFNPTSGAVGIQVSSCSFKNTGSGRAVQLASGAYIIGCYCETASTTLECVRLAAAISRVYSSYIVGGSVGIDNGSTGGIEVAASVITGSAGDGILINGNVTFFVNGCTIYNTVGDGVRRSGGTTNAAQCRIFNTVFSEIGGYAFNNQGTDFGIASLAMNGCLFHAVTSGQVNGVADPINENVATDSGSPFENAATGDFRLLTTSNGYGTAIPSTFMRTTLDTVLDRGAVQRLRTGGGGEFFYGSF
jgi:hypothetical protein